jgi:hypothetical protein
MSGSSCKGEDGRSASYGWEMQQQNGTKAAPSSFLLNMEVVWLQNKTTTDGLD